MCENATMEIWKQVKQQKKSSNKWSCAVCNEKQSVRKVFALGFMAKDVRKFVQNFNLSRQLSDQKQFLEDELEACESQSDEHKKTKKRNDWTEYVDNQEEHCGKFDKDKNLAEGDGGLEPMVVTEMPEALFKKPKLKDCSSGGYVAGTLVRPLFPNRSTANRHHNDVSQDTQLTEFERRSCERAPKRSCMGLRPSDRSSKWNSFRAQIQDKNSNLANMEEPFLWQPTKGGKGSISKWRGNIAEEDDGYANAAPIQQPHMTTAAAKEPVSKWSSYITEEEEDSDLETRGRRNSRDHASQPSLINPLESLMNNAEKVEDDIHPDFL